MSDYIELYTDFLASHAEIKKPLSIVTDSSNGVTGMILKELLPKLGLSDVTLINDNPDPEFSAHGPNPLASGALDELTKTVVEKKADLGVAFDADGDRAFFVDEKGTVLPSFITAALLFKHLPPPYVADELVYQAHHHMKLFSRSELHPSKVGVFFIKQVMKVKQATAGAEFSGHFYFKDFFGADSGLFAMIKVLSILSTLPQSLSEFAASLPPHCIKNEDLNIDGKNWLEIQNKIMEAYSLEDVTIERREGITLQLKNGWVNIRPSNTEPILRIYAGAETKKEAGALVEEIKRFV
jgi:phosphomannomutase